MHTALSHRRRPACLVAGQPGRAPLLDRHPRGLRLNIGSAQRVCFHRRRIPGRVDLAGESFRGVAATETAQGILAYNGALLVVGFSLVWVGGIASLLLSARHHPSSDEDPEEST